MRELHTVSGTEPDLAEPLTIAQQEVLERAVAKVVLLGELVGVSADHMILLLDSGLTVSELLEYVGVRTRQINLRRAPLRVCVKGPEGD
jgi:hypothetical protein